MIRKKLCQKCVWIYLVIKVFKVHIWELLIVSASNCQLVTDSNQLTFWGRFLWSKNYSAANFDTFQLAVLQALLSREHLHTQNIQSYFLKIMFSIHDVPSRTTDERTDG